MKTNKLSIIYEPKGAAREYADLALNIYSGCSHGCRYCYAPAALRKKKEVYFSNPSPRDNILRKVKHDAALLSEHESIPEVLLSFIGDPYQPAENSLGLTRSVIEILIENQIPFTILTKGDPRRDFDIFAGYEKARIGITMTFIYAEDHAEWEPYATSFQDRFNVLKEANSKGISTWVSLEPVIDPAQALTIIGMCNQYVDMWKIGKLNHNSDVASRVDWKTFVTDAAKTLDCLNARYEFKRSLQDYL